MKARRKARRLALQALYEIDCTGHAVADVVKARLVETTLSETTESFLNDLVSGVLNHREALDALIHTHAPEWPLEQMAIVDRNILRLAIYEFAVGQLTPMKVVINEAVELAKVYGSDSAPRFINGVLGAVADRQAEVVASFKRQADDRTAA